MNATWLGFVALAVAIGSWLATGVALRYLRHRAILDMPNDRSSHSAPTPRGGGLGVLAAAIPAWGLLGSASHAEAVTLGAALLGVVAWMDDVRGLPALPRFLAQIVAVSACLFFAPLPGLVFQGVLPEWLDPIMAGLLWLWFINLFNFMDGIDGIAGVETLSVALGLAALMAAAGIGLDRLALTIVLAAAAIGFLIWNWHPAKIFLGDVGSQPLGLLLGWLLLMAAADGQWAAALLLPLYYWTDATITLTRRALRGEKIWRAHRSHFYQRAVAAGRSHAQVSTAVLIANLGLIASMFAAQGLNASLGVLCGALIVGLLLLWMARKP